MLHVGQVVQAKVKIEEEDEGGAVVYALPGDLGEVVDVLEGSVMVAWPKGATECDPSELAGDDAAGRAIRAAPRADP